MPDPNLTRLVSKNLCYTIEAAVGSSLFKHIYVRDQSGKDYDTLNDGELSCALVVSAILALNGLIDRPHATVATTLKTMQTAGWKLTTQPKPGDVTHWPISTEGHEHIGFMLKEGQFVSNSAKQHVPVQHGQALDDGRLPDAYYTHDLLNL